MRKIIDRVMLTAKPTSRLSHLEMRKKVVGYIELISSTDKRDPEELAGAEYLRAMADAPDPRFTGC
jgi:hypothetical protein